MTEVPILGPDGQPILYADLHNSSLMFSFQYFARNKSESDYEVIYTVAPEDFHTIALMFALNPNTEILALISQINDLGQGSQLAEALSESTIKREIFTWSS